MTATGRKMHAPGEEPALPLMTAFARMKRISVLMTNLCTLGSVVANFHRLRRFPSDHATGMN
jgi:hypothetical protein